MMQKANYSEYAAHKPLHNDFLKTLDSLKCPLSNANIKFAKEWLVGLHVKYYNRKIITLSAK